MLPKKIKLEPPEFFLQRGTSHVPRRVYQHGDFNFDAQDFAIGDDEGYLKRTIIGGEYQEKSLTSFLADPTSPQIYACSSQPDDDKAQYFAAYLLQQYLKRVANASPFWIQAHQLSKEPKEKGPASILVLTGLAKNSTQWRIEKARDLLEMYSDIPRIVTVAGDDAVTFFMTQLHMKNHRIFHYCSGAVKRKVAVV